jgi:hypothetical protein
MHIRLVTAVASGAFSMIAVACSISTPPPPDQDEGEFCTDWAKAICQLANGPCNFIESVCTTYQTGVCTNFVAAQSGTGQYSQPNGKACIDALNGAYGGSPSSIPAKTLFAVKATCSKVVVGTQPAGMPCQGDNDCSGTLVCAPEVGQNQSVCVTGLTPKNAGDICADPGDECQGDSYCALPASGLPRCVASAATGGSCNGSIPCGSTDHCVNGLCQTRGLSGESCTSSDDCSSSAPYCDTYTPAGCTDGLTFARGSDDCNGIVGVDQADSGTPSVTVTDAGPGLSD